MSPTLTCAGRASTVRYESLRISCQTRASTCAAHSRKLVGAPTLQTGAEGKHRSGQRPVHTVLREITNSDPRTLGRSPPNKPLQRSGLDKVLGRGRVGVVLEQVPRARVLKRLWPVAERGC
jgi:hypothetical protein